MKPGRGAVRLVAAAAAFILASCGTPPRPLPAFEPEETIGGAVSPGPLEQRLRKQAQSLYNQERWAEAAVQWEILQLLRPDVREYAGYLKDSLARGRQAASGHLEVAREARAENNMNEAMVSYLKALRADPGNKAAIRGLRDIEVERAATAYVYRTGRGNATARYNHVPTTAKVQPAPYGKTRQELDLGVMLFHQGDYSASIRTLEKYLQADPQDETGRRYLGDAHFQLAKQRLGAGKREEALASMEKAQQLKGQESAELTQATTALRNALADDYYQKGVRAYYTDIDKAIGLWERALQFDPNHKQTAIRLQQARRAKQNLKAMEGRDKRP